MAEAVREALITYRYLRMALVTLVVMLGASILFTEAAADCWQGSISDYYYTPSHLIFVASLCAIGICLIVYRGHTATEDLLLNFSGLLAFVVALVPTTAPTLCGAGMPGIDDPTAAAGNNIGALLVAVTVGVASYGAIRLLLPMSTTKAPEAGTAHPPHALLRLLRRILRLAARPVAVLDAVLPWLLTALLAALAIAFFVDPRFSGRYGHNIAAIAMFLGIIAVVVHYALYAAARRSRTTRRMCFVLLYLSLAAAMIVTLALAIAADFTNHPLGVLIVEALLILAFAVFWIVQTIDLWDLDAYSATSLTELLHALESAATPSSAAD
ncbi:diphosphate--fructose-6-phosphate 1-phosphotransferase [Mycobacterium sp. WMMD1722]|uniref:diphosphate--fructose-6-phosphate 1-phosphotransferase n=1 Tax=Mycobacterium sp. WMMD1722 TaxID=3404117 RepID=UPI003BF5C510